ncbi:unnamed protein product [Prorocentrum cordatum]|uniref:Uncharacterized protein n=1 Tax=Prorocentrum cordatum TaxID=2364126 RepID=A0ABN9WU58_9DINO|nr:unnamed protein product [Polarella glacialis]
MLQDFGAALAEQGNGEAARTESDGLSLARTQSSSGELLDLGDDHGASAHTESWGASALPRDGEAPALFQTARPEMVLLGGGRPQGGPAVLRRLPSAAFWEQRAAAAARRPGCSPWELGPRKRGPCHDEEA